MNKIIKSEHTYEDEFIEMVEDNNYDVNDQFTYMIGIQPENWTDEDTQKAKQYDVDVAGYYVLGNNEGMVVAGTLQDIFDFSDQYFGMGLHPDYVCPVDTFDWEDGEWITGGPEVIINTPYYQQKRERDRAEIDRIMKNWGVNSSRKPVKSSIEDACDSISDKVEYYCGLNDSGTKLNAEQLKDLKEAVRTLNVCGAYPQIWMWGMRTLEEYGMNLDSSRKAIKSETDYDNEDYEYYKNYVQDFDDVEHMKKDLVKERDYFNTHKDTPGSKKRIRELNAKEKAINEFVNSSRKPIKSAVDYGWEVDSSDAWEALDMWKEAVGDEQALDDIAQAMGNYELGENLEYIFRMEELGDYDDYDNAWDAYEYAREMVGASSLLDSLARAMGTDELAENMVFIFRMNDFEEWNEQHAPEPDDEDITDDGKVMAAYSLLVDIVKEENNLDYFVDRHWSQENADKIHSLAHGLENKFYDYYDGYDSFLNEYEEKGGTYSIVDDDVDNGEFDDMDIAKEIFNRALGLINEYEKWEDERGEDDDDLDFQEWLEQYHSEQPVTSARKAIKSGFDTQSVVNELFDEFPDYTPPNPQLYKKLIYLSGFLYPNLDETELHNKFSKYSCEDWLDELYKFGIEPVMNSRRPIKSSINTEVVENFPDYMVYYAVYGEPGGDVTDEDIQTFEEWRKRNGYGWCYGYADGENEYVEKSFDSHPAFGLACETVPVVFEKIQSSRKPVKSACGKKKGKKKPVKSTLDKHTIVSTLEEVCDKLRDNVVNSKVNFGMDKDKDGGWIEIVQENKAAGPGCHNIWTFWIDSSKKIVEMLDPHELNLGTFKNDYDIFTNIKNGLNGGEKRPR